MCATSIGSLLVSLVTNRVTLEEVLNWWLILVASCLDDENEIPLKIIASFSAVRFALPSIPLIVLHSLVRSVFCFVLSTKSLHFCRYVRRFVSGCLYSVMAVQVTEVALLRSSSRLVITSISAGAGSRWSLWRQ